jgi:hypothetical protein
MLMPDDGDATVLERRLAKEFPFQKTIRSIDGWIFSQSIAINNYLMEKRSEKDLKAPMVVPILPRGPKKRQQTVNLSNSTLIIQDASDSESEPDSDDVFDAAEAARAIANHRGPTQARAWAIENLGREKAHVTPETAYSLQKLHKGQATARKSPSPLKRKRSRSPLFVRSGPSSVDSNGERKTPDPYEFIKAASQRSSSIRSKPVTEMQKLLRNKEPSFTSDGRLSSGYRQPSLEALEKTLKRGNGSKYYSEGQPTQVLKKKSLLDEQPDARRISFESQGRRETPLSPPAASRKRRRESPEFPHSPSSDGSDDDFKDPYTPKIDPERLQRSRASAAARQPSPFEDILDRIYGRSSPVERNSDAAILARIHGSPIRIPPAAPGRKGLGFAWSREEEEFLIQQIGIYGIAWADLARAHCGPGGRLENRDQAKLKDKARNLKVKMLRYVAFNNFCYVIVTFFGMVTN